MKKELTFTGIEKTDRKFGCVHIIVMSAYESAKAIYRKGGFSQTVNVDYQKANKMLKKIRRVAMLRSNNVWLSVS